MAMDTLPEPKVQGNLQEDDKANPLYAQLQRFEVDPKLSAEKLAAVQQSSLVFLIAQRAFLTYNPTRAGIRRKAHLRDASALKHAGGSGMVYSMEEAGPAGHGSMGGGSNVSGSASKSIDISPGKSQDGVVGADKEDGAADALAVNAAKVVKQKPKPNK